MRFLTEDFLLTTDTARELYHEHAEKMPIVDYHCHINARDIAQNVSFGNITNVWLDDDHYKWTAMRWCGVDERYITGDATDYEKFEAYAACMEDLIGNPLYHWSHLELKMYFGYEGVLNKETAPEVWELANKRLAQMHAKDFMREANVKLICTTDDPADELIWHEEIVRQGFEIRVLPAFRPDKALDLRRADYCEYIAGLGKAAGVEIRDLATLLAALDARLTYFAEHGCSVSDHGLTGVGYEACTEEEAKALLARRLGGERIDGREAQMFQTYMMLWLGRQYAERGWAMQLHFGVLRDINPTLMQAIGVDAGGDCIGSANDIEGLARYMGELEAEKKLPRTVLYSINPSDNAALSVLCGCFQTGEAKGKIQHGSAWWFNDTKIGMESHLKMMASVCALGSFVGMLTDSRSFLSYARHEYFRRILCNYLGNEVAEGAYPKDMKALSRIVRNICYNNTVEYFRFRLEGE